MTPHRKQFLIGIALAVGVSLFGCAGSQAKPLHHRKAHAHSFVPRDANGNAARPAGCPSRWCGCWLMRHFGLKDKRLWRAINWAKMLPHTSAHIGAVAVWPHHVGKIVGGSPGHWIILSGNDGHRVRRRERTTRGVVAFVDPNSGQYAMTE